MTQLSPKVKEKNGAKWCAALAPDLLNGETIWALVSAGRMKPVTSGAAITNARIIGFWHNGESTDKRIVLEVMAHQIRGVDFPVKAGSTSMRVMTDQGEVNFGNLHKDEVGFAHYFIDYLWRNGVDPAVAHAIDQRHKSEVAAQLAEHDYLSKRESVKVFGGALKDKWWNDIRGHAHPGELPWFIINSGSAGRLVAFEDRLLISKTGGMTSLMAGSFGGGRETTFPYSDITNIEYNGGFANGVLEVLTPSYQGTGNHDYWRSTNKARNTASDDPWTLSNCLPLAKHIYREAQPTLNELHRKIMDAKRPQVVVHHAPADPSPAPAPAADAGLADELTRLAEMHQQGVLDDDEFKAAKKAAIARQS
jgi:hypothetical protein